MNSTSELTAKDSHKLRAKISAQAMAGVLASQSEQFNYGPNDYDAVAKEALRYADALIKELEN